MGLGHAISTAISPSFYKKEGNHNALVYNKKTKKSYYSIGNTNISGAVVKSVLNCKKASGSFSDCLTVAIDDRYFGGQYNSSCENVANGDYKTVKLAKAIAHSPKN